MSDDVVARIGDGVAAFDAAEWDACAGGDNPFVSHAFLSALEESGSATARRGWQPVPIAIDGPDGRLAAVLPAYVKSHSQGEYVFDHAWADAWAARRRAIIIPSCRSPCRSRRCRARGC